MNQRITVIQLDVPDEIREQLITSKMTCYGRATIDMRRTGNHTRGLF